MINMAMLFLNFILLGLGATLVSDLWALLLKHAFNINPSNICLLGRWIQYMLEGTFRHSDIRSTPQKSGECTVGWIAHYLTGITFAIGFAAFAGRSWLQHPTLIPALVFGTATVLAPYFIMQPSFGFGIAGSKTSNPFQGRVRSLMNHFVFGLGLYLSGLLAAQFLAA